MIIAIHHSSFDLSQFPPLIHSLHFLPSHTTTGRSLVQLRAGKAAGRRWDLRVSEMTVLHQSSASEVKQVESAKQRTGPKRQ